MIALWISALFTSILMKSYKIFSFNYHFLVTRHYRCTLRACYLTLYVLLFTIFAFILLLYTSPSWLYIYYILSLYVLFICTLKAEGNKAILFYSIAIHLLLTSRYTKLKSKYAMTVDEVSAAKWLIGKEATILRYMRYIDIHVFF